MSAIEVDQGIIDQLHADGKKILRIAVPVSVEACNEFSEEELSIAAVNGAVEGIDELMGA